MSTFRQTEAWLAQRLATQAKRPPARAATFVLPWPPTVNHMYRPGARNGKRLLTDEYKAFKEHVMAIVGTAMAQGMSLPMVGRLKVTIQASAPDKRKRDIDGVLKCALDSLQHAGVYADDYAIEDLRILRVPSDRPGVTVYIETIGERNACTD